MFDLANRKCITDTIWLFRLNRFGLPRPRQYHLLQKFSVECYRSGLFLSEKVLIKRARWLACVVQLRKYFAPAGYKKRHVTYELIDTYLIRDTIHAVYEDVLKKDVYLTLTMKKRLKSKT